MIKFLELSIAIVWKLTDQCALLGLASTFYTPRTMKYYLTYN